MELYRMNLLGGTFQSGRATPLHARDRITEMFHEGQLDLFRNLSRNENQHFIAI